MEYSQAYCGRNNTDPTPPYITWMGYLVTPTSLLPPGHFAGKSPSKEHESQGRDCRVKGKHSSRCEVFVFIFFANVGTDIVNQSGRSDGAPQDICQSHGGNRLDRGQAIMSLYLFMNNTIATIS